MQLNDALSMDTSGYSTTGGLDGILDLSLLQVFRPLDQRDGVTTPSDIVFPDCTAPESSTTCTLPAGGMRSPADATNMASGACVDILPNTTTTGWGATTQMGPCYSSNVGDLVVSLSGIPVTLHQTVVGAQYSGTPATQLINGLIRGFLTEADANATTIPSSVSFVGGMQLSEVLPGGTG